MSLQVQPASVSQFVLVNLRSSTTGQLLTGIDNTEITVSYWRPGAVAPVAESSVTAGTLGTYGAKTWIEYSTTGRYQYCPSNAAIASGVPYVDLLFTATGAIDKIERVWLVGSLEYKGTFHRKYATGTGNSVGLSLAGVNGDIFVTDSTWTPQAGEVTISKDGAAAANITSLPTYSNGRWFFSFSNTELTAKRIYVNAIASTIQSVSFVIETYGHASAQIPQDLGAANWTADIKAYDGVAQTPSAAGYPDVNLVALGGVGFTLGDIAHLMYQGVRFLFVSTAGDTGNDGLSPGTAKALPSQAISIASAGDVILVEAGTYDEVSTAVDVPDDVQLIGAGWQRTIINSQVRNVTPNFRSIVEPGSRSRIKGIAFIGNETGDFPQRAIGVGTGSGAFVNAVIEDCRFFGNVDGLQLAKIGATNSAKFYRCRFESGFDAVAMSMGTNTIEFYDCEFLADVSWIPVGYTQAGAICRGIVVASASTTKVNIHGGRYLATGGSDTNTGVQVSGSGSTVNVYGGMFDCSIYDLERTAGTLNVFDVPYATAKTSGTINVFGTASNVLKVGNQDATATGAVDFDDLGTLKNLVQSKNRS